MIPARRALRAIWLAVVIACACTPALPPLPSQRPTQEPARRGRLAQQIALARQGGEQPIFRPPTPAQMRSLERWTRSRLLGADEPPPSGFFSHSLTGRNDLLLTREADDPRGSGIFVFRERTPRLPVMVQVPHSWADLHTLPVGLSIFETLEAKALLVNTAHRNRGCPATDVRCNADVAHADRSYFQAVHAGVLSAYPNAVTIAIHGFAERPGDPLVILSAAGTPVDLSELQSQLSAALDGLHDTPVMRFGEQIDRLGGITGTQAKHSRRNAARMVHIELSRDLRERFLDDEGLRRRFAEALGRGLEVLR